MRISSNPTVGPEADNSEILFTFCDHLPPGAELDKTALLLMARRCERIALQRARK